MTNGSRNEFIESEAGAASALTEDQLALAARFGVEPEQARVTAAAHFLSRSAYRCDGGCRRLFVKGDVVFLRRGHDDWENRSAWKLMACCLDCVSKWHPSWLEDRSEPVECAGGCGVLVTSAYWQTPATCSHRCSEVVARAKRRVSHDEVECVECHEAFVPTRSDASYCSTRCRMRAYRQRKSA